ncbi:ras-related and estrogen-regulated growth inhibitor-like isoform X2 [Apostichopus japonicus]
MSRRRASTISGGFDVRKHKSGNKTPQLTFRIVVVGAPGVGKTALTVRYTTRRFIGEYDPTLESLCTIVSNIDGQDVTMEILDTAGEMEVCHRTAYALWGDTFLYLYSISDRRSFEIISEMKGYIESSQSKTSSTGILVGNKNDLLADRLVSYEEAYLLAESLQLPFCEISVKDGEQLENVAEIFRILYRFWKESSLCKTVKVGQTLPLLDEEERRTIETNKTMTEGNLTKQTENMKESVTSPMKKMKLILFQRFTRPRLTSF